MHAPPPPHSLPPPALQSSFLVQAGGGYLTMSGVRHLSHAPSSHTFGRNVLPLTLNHYLPTYLPTYRLTTQEPTTYYPIALQTLCCAACVDYLWGI